MTNADKYDDLIARATTPEDKKRLIDRRDRMSYLVARSEYKPYGEFEQLKLEELESEK